MTRLHSRLTRQIHESPEGPEIGAFFDFDRTLISGFSAFPFIREQLQTGKLNPAQFLKLFTAMTNFGFKMADFSDLLNTSAAIMKGVSEDSYVKFGETVYRKHLAKLVYPESRALVEAHLEKGHTVVVVSSATPYQVHPAASDLGVQHILCSELEVEDGKFTGQVSRFCWGEGKVEAAEELAEERGIDLEQSFAYSDGHEDVPLLELVGNPRAVNPSPKLASYARRHRWPISRFASRSRPRSTDFMRSIAATYSIIPTFAAGLPIWALTGSKREALNYSVSLFADTASALIGLNLKVKGEANLWEHRPAVFVFNHQSKADVVIMAKLLRRDIASVGKKEIRNLPVIGQILEYGGVVMIDRKNSSSAIEAMKPLVDVMRKEGKSVCLAPEGTRSVSTRLGPFKKGAFHLAMQAGVPIVPVVIHNALDAAPKGTFTFRPATVKVEVLPPVDTSRWRPETIDEHVAEVRSMFLRVLGQEDEEKPARKSAGRKAPKKSAKKPARAQKKSARKAAPTSEKKSAAKPSRKAPGKSAMKASKTVAPAAKVKTPRKARPRQAAPPISNGASNPEAVPDAPPISRDEAASLSGE